MKTTGTTRSTLFALLTTVVLLMPMAAAAQQADTPQTDTTAEPEAEESSPDTAVEPVPAEGGGDNGSGEVFIPSEEISEDFAVSFPVDI